MSRNELLLSAAISLALTSSIATSAAAQEAAVGSVLEGVVVTAERRDSNQQITPVATTVLNQATIEARGIRELQGLAKATPNVQIRTATGNRDAAVMSIRGHIETQNLITTDTAVGVYLDDVYMARMYGLLADMLDVGAVEVDRGPQGVLFGRNTNGGAIRLTSNKPKLSEFGGYVRASYGNFTDVNITGAVNIPIIKDELAIRYAVLHHEHRGYTTAWFSPNGLGDPRVNPLMLRPVKQDDLDNWAHRLSLNYAPNDRFSVWLTADKYKNDTAGQLFYNVFGDLNVGAEVANGANLVVSPQHLADFRSGLTNSLGFTHVKTDGLHGEVRYDITDNVSSKLILGYRHAKTFTREMVNGTYGTLGAPGSGAITIDASQNDNADKQYTAELQFLGDLMDDRLDWLLGLYYFREKGFDRQNRDRTVNGLAPLPNDEAIASRESHGINKSKSVFFHLNYKFTDKLSAGAGIRWTQDNKDLTVFSTDRAPNGTNGTNPPPPTTTPGGNCLLPRATPTSPCSLTTTTDNSYVTWAANVDYRFTDDIFGYAKVSTGQRSGGGQGRALNLATATPFGPEKDTSYEVGLKSEFLERRLRLNLALFHDNVRGLQQTFTASVAAIPPSTAQTTTFTVNAGDVKRNGFELDAKALLGAGFSAEGSVGYYKEDRSLATYFNPVTSTQTTFRYLNRHPWTGSLSFMWDGDTQAGMLHARIDTNFVPQIFPTTSIQVSPAPASLVGSSLDPHGYLFKGVTLVNARVTLDLTDKLNVGAWVQNAFDKNYYRAGFVTGALFTGNFGDPRTYGVTVGYTF